MLTYVADRDHYTEVLFSLRKGQARPVDRHRRPEGLVCGGRSECGALPLGARQTAQARCRHSSAARQRTR